MTEGDYTLFYTDSVDKETANSVLLKMISYRDMESRAPLPDSLDYELALEEGCYQFYIKKQEQTELAGGSIEMIKSFAAQLNEGLFAEYCLTAGAWDLTNQKWQDSVQFNSGSQE